MAGRPGRAHAAGWGRAPQPACLLAGSSYGWGGRQEPPEELPAHHRSYLAHGTATDYMFKTLHVPIASTWEIYGDLAAHVNDCFRMFNPIGKQQMEVRACVPVCVCGCLLARGLWSGHWH